ncbi:MAG: response regulator transcription factor [Bacteroidales bacterium]|nr:response regulator transcription factor [Bacteroidales bacterium]
MEEKISVIIVDDFEVFRVGLKYMLNTLPFVDQVFEAVNSKELNDLLKKADPDVIFMDVNLGDENGVDLTRQILAKHPYTYLIAITSSKDIEYFIKMMDAGAVGFLLKNITQKELEVALSDILKGNTYFSKEFLTAAKQLLPRKATKKKVQLSEREQEVLKHICLGYSNQEIAEQLDLSSHTIDAHRKKLLSKIGARNTASMIMMSIKEGIIDLD